MPLFSKDLIIGMIAVGGFAIGLVVGSSVTWNLIRPDGLEVTTPKGTALQQEEIDGMQNEEGNTEEDGEMEYILFEEQEYAVLSRYPLDESDPTRELLHVCDPKGVGGYAYGARGEEVYLSPLRLICGQGAEYLVLIDNGQSTLIQPNGVDLYDQLFVLKDARLLDETHLLIAFEQDVCSNPPFGMCIDGINQMFMVNPVDGEILDELEGVGYIYDLENLYFNADFTKYVTTSMCAEGCPEDVIEGYDLVKKQKKQFRDVIVHDGEWFGASGSERVDENYWIDNKTFHLVVRKYQGNKVVGVKELNLTF